MDIYFTGYFTAFIIISLVYIDHIKLNIWSPNKCNHFFIWIMCNFLQGTPKLSSAIRIYSIIQV